jgi:hypothetical protein
VDPQRLIELSGQCGWKLADAGTEAFQCMTAERDGMPASCA